MLTVLLSTYNRAQSLAGTLGAFCRLESYEPWKLVVIDNDSVDDTQAVLSEFAAKLPLTYLIERTRGKSSALNTGLAHIAGDLVVFTDDDVRPKSDWLLRMREAANQNRDFAVFGGRILPEWEIEPDPTLARSSIPLTACFTLTNRLDGPCPIIDVYGPNMALRSEVIGRGYRFNPSIGPDGSEEYAMGGETELLLRLGRDGYRAWHCQSAVVSHIVRAEQVTVAWLLGRAVKFGRGRQQLASSGLLFQLGERRPTTRVVLALCGVPGAGILLRLLCTWLEPREQSRRLLALRWWLHVLVGVASRSKINRNVPSIG